MEQMQQKGPQIRIKLQAYGSDELLNAVALVQAAISDTGAHMGTAFLPTKRTLFCVLRSPHANSNSREHFQILTHQRMVKIRNLTKEAVQNVMILDMPAGVHSEVSIS